MTQGKILLLILLLLGVCAGEGALAGDPVQKRLANLKSTYGRGNPQDCRNALGECTALLGTPGLAEEFRKEARILEAGLLARSGNEAAAFAAAQQLRQAFPNDLRAGQAAVMAEYDALRVGKKFEPARAKAEEAATSFAADKAFCAQAWTKVADLYFRAKAYDPAFEAAGKALAADPLVAREELEGAYFYQEESAFNTGKWEVCVQVLAPTFDAWPAHKRTRLFQDRYLDALWRLKRFDDVRSFLARLMRDRVDPADRQYLALRVGWSFGEQQRYDEALAAYEKVFTEHPLVSNAWWETQNAIVDVLRRKGDKDKALQSARVLLDAAGDREAFLRGVQITGDILREIDGKAGRDKELQYYQLTGPAEGVADPLAGVAYPDLSARREAFDKARGQLGYEMDDIRQRARMCLYAGEPRRALGFYQQALRRAGPSDYGQEFGRTASEMIWAGARTCRGYAGKLQPFFQFVLFGPAGEDGKASTGDDLADPFAALGAENAVIELPAEVAAELRKAQAYLKDIAGDENEAHWRKDPVLSGLRRVQESLNAWQEEIAFYETLLGDRERRMVEQGVVGRLAAAKGGEYHVGGVRHYLAEQGSGWQDLGVVKNLRRFLEQFGMKQALPESFGKKPAPSEKQGKK